MNRIKAKAYPGHQEMAGGKPFRTWLTRRTDKSNSLGGVKDPSSAKR
jgi:hypothetical protein